MSHDPHFPLQLLREVAEEVETPCYIYLLEPIRGRFESLEGCFGDRFSISYAVKANPALGLLNRFSDLVEFLDCSSIGEVEKGIAAGYRAERLTFSGPAKRREELRRAVQLGIGAFISESLRELEALNAIAAEAGSRVKVLPRINPLRMPAKFGVNMAGKPSQFGIDEEEMPEVLGRLADFPHLKLEGFHIYSGTNCLDEEAIAENFEIFLDLFRRFSAEADICPGKLIFGSGFGIPYHDSQGPLDLERHAELVNPPIDALPAEERFADTQCVLEMGRWLVGPGGFLLTSVVGEKRSRGATFYLCDAGFNNHLAACGMMGSIIRRNWPIARVTGSPESVPQACHLVGPLCTTIDQIASDIEIGPLRIGDVLAIGSSGAYGVSASPTGFISHPKPREYVVSTAERIVEL